MNELALFAGAGGGILGGKLLGWRTVCAVEIEPYCRERLMQRQDEGHLPAFPIWDDVRTFDGKPWSGIVDVVTGGFPCQDISAAGKGAGITGERSGLWKEMARIIGEVRPRFAFVENSPMLTSRGLGVVLGDLAEMGFDARWGVLGAEDAIWDLCDPCIDHERARIFVLASADTYGSRRTRERPAQPEERHGDFFAAGSLSTVPNALLPRLSHRGQTGIATCEDETIRGLAFAEPERRGLAWWSVEPALGRVAHGVANRVDRIRAIGNGQVPAVVRLAWETLTESYRGKK